jgi:hypothetical protein
LNVAGDDQEVFTGAVQVKPDQVTMNVELWEKFTVGEGITKVATNFVFICASVYPRLFTYHRLFTHHHDHLDCSNDLWCHRRPLVASVLSDT